MDKFQTLAHYFGYSAFREGQETLIDGILAGKDVLGIMPTGAGKSICYQVPGLMLPGITLVISPLISLMKDQVGALVQSGVSAAFINSTLTPRQSELALYRAANGIYKIIYVAPERLTTAAFAEFAREADISLVVVDEAHCVSQWGQNFRPSYLKIAEFVHSLPQRPVTAAFTATATGRVRNDIIRLLDLHAPAVTTTGFDRANLYFEVMKPKDKFAALTSYLSLNRGKSGIVYCATRKLVEEVADRLTEEGWRAGKYHAGMSDSDRSTAQELFIRDEIPVMVATNAFGMGIDKSNVAFVVHYNMPKNMESYYQEAGRAGRDGQPAECILLYSGQDVKINTFLIEKSFENNDEFDEDTAETLKNNEMNLLRQMTFYSTSKYCYRRFILKYFGENPAFENCGNCSNCTQSHTSFESRDITTPAQKILSCVKRMQEAHTKWMIIDILRGTLNNRVELCGGNKQSTFGIMKDTGTRELEKMIDTLIADKYLTESHDGILAWGMAARGVIYSGMRVTMREQSGRDAKNEITREAEIGRNANPELLLRLRALRKKTADINGVPAFIIFTDASLRDMAEKMPTDASHFQKIHGVGQVKTEKFGRAFMEEIKRFLAENDSAPPAVKNGREGHESNPQKPKKERSESRRKYRPSVNKPNVHLEKDADGHYILPPGADKDLFAALQTLRADLSSDFGIQTNFLVTTDALAQICVEQPVTLAAIKQMGILPPHTEAYCGDEIVRTVRACLERKGISVDEACDCPSQPNLPLLGRLKELRAEISRRIYTPVNRVISDPTLQKMSEYMPVSRSQLTEQIHLGNAKCVVFGKVFLAEIRKYTGETDTPDGFEGAPEIDVGLFTALAELRHQFAKREDKTDLSVLSDYTLYDICVRQPRSEEDFLSVYGVGAVKADRYADAFIGCIHQYQGSEKGD